MDFISLCFLAAEAGADLVALTLEARDPAREDAAYARQAAGRLPAETVHLVFPTAQLPPYLTGLEEGGEPQDEPLTHRRDLAQQPRYRLCRSSSTIWASHSSRACIVTHMLRPCAAKTTGHR